MGISHHRIQCPPQTCIGAATPRNKRLLWNTPNHHLVNYSLRTIEFIYLRKGSTLSVVVSGMIVSVTFHDRIGTAIPPPPPPTPPEQPGFPLAIRRLTE